MTALIESRLARWSDEPFRLFFPLAVLMGMLGVSMWPLYFSGMISYYPGMNHSRVMAFGFFGGFVMGFILTSLPRLLGTHCLRSWELIVLVFLYSSVSLAHLIGATFWGECLTLAWIVVAVALMVPRFLNRQDLPPPGFVLVVLGAFCAAIGSFISILEVGYELDSRWLVLRQLLEFQGFLLLPVTGVAGFILPRILGLAERYSFPESRVPTQEWLLHMLLAFAVGLVVLGSFWWEIEGAFRLAYSVRFVIVVGYLTWLVPWHCALVKGTFSWALRFGLGCFVGGILLIACFPEWRVPFMHLSLGIGLVLISLVVASRVVLGHREQLDRMSGKQRWFVWVVALIFVGVTSRMIGDFIPKILISHYNYGALFWGLGVLLWARRLFWIR